MSFWYVYQKLAQILPTSGGHSVGIVCSRTKATEFSFQLFFFLGLVLCGMRVFDVVGKEIPSLNAALGSLLTSLCNLHAFNCISHMMHFIRLHIRVTSFLPWYFEMK
jgi:hypothetical protein